MSSRPARKVKKVAKIQDPEPVFKAHAFQKTTKIKYGTKNQLYVAKVDVKNARYHDIQNYVYDIQKKIAKQHPGSYMNVSIKYASQNTPISAGYYSTDDEPSLKTPYNYYEQDDVDFVEAIYLQIAV